MPIQVTFSPKPLVANFALVVSHIFVNSPDVTSQSAFEWEGLLANQTLKGQDLFVHSIDVGL